MHWYHEGAYHDLWCPPGMSEADPSTCKVGLAIGYGWVPAVIIFTIAVILYLVIRSRRKQEKGNLPD